jgi:hypothetical protein
MSALSAIITGAAIPLVAFALAASAYQCSPDRNDVRLPGYQQRLKLTPKERQAHIVYTERTEPITIEFHTPAQINSEEPGAVAYARKGSRNGCRIVLPTGVPIAFDPGGAGVALMEPEDMEVVIHELLHCLRMGWHD